MRKSDNKIIIEYALKPSFSTRKLKEQQKEIKNLQQELQRKDNIINKAKETIKELIDDSEDTTCYEITNTIKRLLLEELESGE